MIWLDYLILIFLLLGCYRGFSKGLIIEVASLVALVLAIWGGINFTTIVIKILNEKYAFQSDWLPAVAFLMVFIFILVAVFTLAKLLEALVKITMLSLLNKVSGALFGVLKYSLLVIFMVYIIDIFNQKIQFYNPDQTHKSKFYNPALKISKALVNLTDK